MEQVDLYKNYLVYNIRQISGKYKIFKKENLLMQKCKKHTI